MILVIMHFGNESFNPHQLIEFEEIKLKVKEFLLKKLESTNDNYINLIMVDDDSQVTSFEDKKVIVTAFLPKELDFDFVSKNINASIDQFITKNTEVDISCIEITNSRVYKKLN